MSDVPVFSPQQREQIRGELVLAAPADVRIGAAAHLGSAAIGLEDRWSDIDLAVCLVPNADMDGLLTDWTGRMYRDHGAVAQYDLKRGEILYRVFLLDNTLQVDLSFWPCGELAAIGPKFSLIFGVAGESKPAPVPDSHELIGMAWLYALHVRSSIARSRLLQAEYMLSGMRDSVLALMCKRQGVSALQGRGLDDLLQEQKKQAAECLAHSLEPVELTRAFRMTVDCLLVEVGSTNPELVTKLESPLRLMVNSLSLDR
jgi:hypothetical protein